ncbi:anti-sigma factor RsbA family regulatory protein [Micromonospora psammae]|uniref:anti-sigma factor RsbA family regulatory protein n=1 Tax=Micromonospora sp. CPCC 205556 TaxID=3122398 RepID=UPI002FEF38AE
MTDPDGLRHDALFYDDDRGYLDAITGFVAQGRAAGEPVLVAVPADRLARVGPTLGAADGVTLADMSALGRNPAAIIPAVLRDFVHRHSGRRSWIVGESLWPGRPAATYRHCAEHEAMINLALGSYPLTVLCLFDRDRLPAEALADARRTHPVVRGGAGTGPSVDYQPPEQVLAGCAAPLSPPPGHAATMPVTAAGLGALRAAVAADAHAAGLPADRTDDLRIVITELATNAISHAGGPATARWWLTAGALACEVSAAGGPADPLAGRIPAAATAERGRGLLLVHQLCDLVDVGSAGGTTTVRVHLALPPVSIPAPRSAAGATERGFAPGAFPL